LPYRQQLSGTSKAAVVGSYNCETKVLQINGRCRQRPGNNLIAVRHYFNSTFELK